MTNRLASSVGVWVAVSLLCFSSHALGDSASIHILADRPGPALNPRMYGVFLEEINHGVDGGLYGELIRNRGFEDSRPPEGYTFRDGRWQDAKGFDAGFSRFGYTTEGVPFWSLVKEGNAKGAMVLETSGGVTEASCYCLRLDVEDAAGGRIGVANQGFFGIGVRQGQAYSLSLYARGGEGFTGPLWVRLEEASGAACSDEAKVENIGGGWRQFRATLTASKTETKARLVITVGASGSMVDGGPAASNPQPSTRTVWLDLVSLFPTRTWKDRPNGLRPDIAQMIADLRPGFVRFPGGCVVEAGTVETAYNWKLTVGPIEQRQERWGPWNYRQTHGMGLYEYLQFIEDLGAEPLWVGFDGQTCIFREVENVPMSEMGWVRDNFLDVVEYANGPADSKWGALRAQAGHPAQFGLKYVEIGNENQGHEYEQRYRFVYDAMKTRYPNLTYLADLSWTDRESMRSAVFDIEDAHYYNSPRWFLSRFNEYDQRDRKLPPLYLGEVAVTSQDAGPTRGNLLAALAEGAFLMGCERNADVVRMVSYAPLLGHVEGRTELTNAPPPWHALIYFDGTRVFGTASYYLWKLLGTNRPDQTVHTEVTFHDANAPAAQHLFAVAGRDNATGDLTVKAVNTSAEPVSARLTISGTQTMAPQATVTVLTSASLRDNNTLEDPCKVTPKTSVLEGDGPDRTVELHPYSFTLIRFKTQAEPSAAAPRPAIAAIDPPEQGFFAKRLDFHGIPIKAPKEVVDEALFAAYGRLERMMAHLPNVPANLADAGAELHIIGRDQVTTDLPEWRQDKGKPLAEYKGLTRDQRTRGMGGLLTSCGEENLLGLESDRYRGRDICVHEFAHDILSYGVPRDIRRQFEAQRQRSLLAGLWVSSYAGSNTQEFFAELAMWYFGTHGDLSMKGSKPANGPDGLKAYDPEAFALMDNFWSGRILIPRLDRPGHRTQSEAAQGGEEDDDR